MGTTLTALVETRFEGSKHWQDRAVVELDKDYDLMAWLSEAPCVRRDWPADFGVRARCFLEEDVYHTYQWCWFYEVVPRLESDEGWTSRKALRALGRVFDDAGHDVRVLFMRA